MKVLLAIAVFPVVARLGVLIGLMLAAAVYSALAVGFGASMLARLAVGCWGSP